MKKILISCLILLLICAAVEAHALSSAIQAVVSSGGVAAASCTGASPSDCDLRETFDGATSCGTGQVSTCNNTWSSALGWPDFQGATPPQGTYWATFSGAGNQYIWKTFTAVSSMYLTTIIKFSSIKSYQESIYLADSTTKRCYFYFDGTDSGKFVVKSYGGTAATGSADYAINTQYYVKIKATTGGGADAICEGWISTNGTTWSDHVSSSDGTWTAEPDEVLIL